MAEPIPSSGLPNPEQPPPITEFSKWLGYHFTKDWRNIVKYPIALLAVCVFIIVVAWLITWHVVVPEKNEQLATKQEMIDNKQDRIDFLNKKLDESERDNDKLRSQNEEYASARAEKTFPLKKRIFILSDQIDEWASRVWAAGKKGDWNTLNSLNNEWQTRLESRYEVSVKQLDELGHYSQSVPPTLWFPQIQAPGVSGDMTNITSGLRQLANNLPDDEEP